MPSDNIALGVAFSQKCSLPDLQRFCKLGIVWNEML